MKRRGVRLPRWKRPANFKRTSTSSRLRSSHACVPSLLLLGWVVQWRSGVVACVVLLVVV